MTIHKCFKGALAAIILLMAANSAFAQSGQLPGSTVWGNPSATQGLARSIPFTTLNTLLDGAKYVQIVTASGTTTVAATTQILIFNKSSPSASPISLPTVVGRDKIELDIYDFTGLAGDITITPVSPQKIMGGTTPWIVGSGGVAQSGGAIKLVPIESLLGWLVQ